VAEDTSIARLYLLPKDWAEQRRIRYELGTTALRVDRERREVALSNGDHISYDRLILATGAEPVFPAIPGSDMAGTFVLRTIDDAVQIQQHVRRRRARTAVIVGGGLLGLEAANAMRQIGVRVFVLDRGAWPLSRQLDQLGGALLRQLMSDLGIEVLSRTSAERLHGSSWVEAVETTDGRTLKADLCLLTAGIRPRVELAQAAGLAVKRGVVVNDQMMTTDPSIFAVGDVADYHGRVYGLWPASVEQAQVAAVNALGGTRPYRFAMPPTRLKVPGVDLLSVGEIQADEPDDHEVRVKDETSRQYRKLVLKGGKVSGGILIGRSDLADEVTAAVEESLDVSAAVEALEQGDWSVLENTTVATVAPR
jgi:NAD(P)H-nitrite reductase large subunit